MRTLIIASLILVGTPALADTLSVGPQKTFATPCAAIAAAKSKDVIEIAAGTYTDSCTISTPDLTLRGVGGRPKIDLSGTDHPAQYKAIYVVEATGVTIENLELTGAHISTDNGSNGAGIRASASGLVVRGCYLHDNQNGILGDGSITVEYSEFFRNGMGDGCTTGGCTHNVYIGNADSMVFRFNWTHRLASDLPDKGHLLKSRARKNYVYYNRITGEDGPDSYEVDFPNGGLAVVVGNVIEKGSNSGNSTLLIWGEEGIKNPDKRMFLVANTFVNDFGSGSFVSASGATLVVTDNVFAGAGSAPKSPNNFVGDPGFVAASAFDYHLVAGSAARGKAVAPGNVDADSLVPMYEYAHAAASVPRPTVQDLGAFEYGTDAGPPNREAGASPSADGGPPPSGDAGSVPNGRVSADAGCACSSSPGQSETGGLAVAALAFAFACVRGRARTRRDNC